MIGIAKTARLNMLRLVLLATMLALIFPARATVDAQSTTSDLQGAFAVAAKEFNVPLAVLLAVSYNESRWEQHDGQSSFAGGYGVMHLTAVPAGAVISAKGDGSNRSAQLDTKSAALHTLTTAAALIGADPAALKKDVNQNIRGGAALLAQYARQTVGASPANAADWYGAVAAYSGSQDATIALGFADDVYATVSLGAARTTATGQFVTLVASSVSPNKNTAGRLNLHNAKPGRADCPPTIACQFIAAAYQQNNPSDPGDYGNYDLANRPAGGLDIRYIVMHDTEETYADTIAGFQNPLSYVSAHYVVRSSDGQVTQMVDNKNVAWHAGNWYVNMHAIGVEHEGFAIEGATWYSERMYRASAKLVGYLARKYHVPLDRTHIIGHDDVPGPTAAYQAGMHWDPGPYWDWSHYMELLGAPHADADKDGRGNIVTIAPNFASNKPPLSYCDPNCRNLPPQSANFVYLYSAPSFQAPLLDDPALPGPATTQAPDWGDKAASGQQFYVAGRQGDWTAIFFGGQKAWFYNPHAANTNPVAGLLITPRNTKDAIPVYGRAYPEAQAYPSNVPVQTIVPLQYTIQPGQLYVAKDLVRSDYYYAPNYTLNPADHILVQGRSKYYQIFFNHRFAFVLASDVKVIGER